MIFPGESKGAVIGSRPYSIGRRGLPWGMWGGRDFASGGLL